MTVKWNPNFERDLARQIEPSLGKVTIPCEVSEMNVESLDDDCHRILLRLDEHCKDSSSCVDYRDMAKQLDLEDECVSIAYDRFEHSGLIMLAEASGGTKAAYISREGRIAADDLRKLPEKRHQQEKIEAKQRRRERWSFHYEKLVLPIIVAIAAGLIGWFAHSAWNASSSQQSSDPTNRNLEGSS